MNMEAHHQISPCCLMQLEAIWVHTQEVQDKNMDEQHWLCPGSLMQMEVIWVHRGDGVQVNTEWYFHLERREDMGYGQEMVKERWKRRCCKGVVVEEKCGWNGQRKHGAL